MSDREIELLHKRERRHRLPNGHLASDYRDAINTPKGEAPPFTIAWDWQDKPHRLVYDLLRMVDVYKRKIDRLERKGQTK